MTHYLLWYLAGMIFAYVFGPFGLRRSSAQARIAAAFVRLCRGVSQKPRGRTRASGLRSNRWHPTES